MKDLQIFYFRDERFFKTQSGYSFYQVTSLEEAKQAEQIQERKELSSKEMKQEAAFGYYESDPLILFQRIINETKAYSVAQGITAELVKHMSQAYPCTYILVGRSADPRNEVSSKELETMKTKEEIRAYLIKSGKFTSPAEIEKETTKVYLKTINPTHDSVIWKRLEIRFTTNH
ncbi:hypothetical protein FQA39_LY18515 [Lamprigera yunnana]|nr:hypothetical protein FQA39_LY18515 [Lamprigera yunnana]